ncbi:hypothetical protein JXB41_02345 [Candidatus Woesearchaeota archaeon]|nr:hypothetical protein [Candidatus Woesearchaeota archaeon]
MKKSPKKLSLKINKRIIISVGIVLLLLLLFKKITVIALLAVSSFIISYIINNLQIKTIGLELVTLSAVITGKVYGPFMGFLVALILITFHLVMSGYIGMYIIWVIPSYCLVGIMSGIFNTYNISFLGSVLTVVLNIIYLSFTFIFSPGRLVKLLPYSISNVIINILLFSTIAQPLMSFIG